jgi:hypothetical protein
MGNIVSFVRAPNFPPITGGSSCANSAIDLLSDANVFAKNIYKTWASSLTAA